MASGLIEFTIDRPVPEVGTAHLVDDRVAHGGRVFLDLELGQSTPKDVLTVDVTWADDALGNKIETSYTVDCEQVGTEPACLTGSFGPGPTPSNPRWSSSPVFELPEDVDFLPYVSVRITNSYGAEVVRTFPIVGEHRARYADRTPFVTLVAGQDNSVPVTTVTPSTLLDQPRIGITPFIEAIAAQLPAGLTPDIEEHPDGSATLLVRGRPESSDIGPVTFTYPVDQLQLENGVYISVPESRPPPAQVTLDIVARSTPGFRAMLWNVPSGGQFAQVREGFPLWGVRVPYTRADGADPEDDPVFAGTVTCGLLLNGQPVDGFPKTCATDEPFPWPAEPVDGSYEVSVRAVGDGGPHDVDETAYTRTLSVLLLQPTLDRRPGSGTTDTLSLEISDFKHDPIRGVVPTPFSAADYSVRCQLETGARFVPCLDTGVRKVLRTPGAHHVRVRVTAPDGARVERELRWRVPYVAARLRVAAPATVTAGKRLRVAVGGLLPTEEFTAVLGGKRRKGVASSRGTGVVVFKVPKSMRGAKRVTITGGIPSRKGSDRVVVKPKRRR